MPLFTNVVPLDDRTRNASDRAGVATIRAIQEAFYGLEAYEFSFTPLPDIALSRLRISGVLFQRAATFYESLRDLVSDSQFSLPQEAREAFDLAFQFHKLLGGGVLRNEAIGDWRFRVFADPVSIHSLIDFTRHVLTETSLGLSDVELNPKDGRSGHRIAADIAVVQMLGLAATKALQAAA